MGFLFGDLTPAPFSTNFLEDLRDAIDFGASIAEADQRIVTADATLAKLRKRAHEDEARLEALVRAVLYAADGAFTGADDSPAAMLATDLVELVGERHRAADAALKAKLAEDMRAVEEATQTARAEYFLLLEEYLLEHLPPAAVQALRVELVTSKKDDRRYAANLVGQTNYGLDWSIEMAVPEEGPWKAPLRIERVAPGLAIHAPGLTGLIKKEVKLKKQKLDRHCVTKIVLDNATLRLELRSELGSAEGFDLAAAVSGDDLMIAKTGDPADVTRGPFDVATPDKEALLDLASRLRTMAGELPKKRLVAASFEGLPFDGTNPEAQPKLVELVSRLVTELAPAVTEIAARSRSEHELVLRRKLADGRREEIFMPKARLREKLVPLDKAHRRLFRAFASALEATSSASVLSFGMSEPPPPPPPPPPPELRSEVPMVRRRSSGAMQAVVVPKPARLPDV